MNTLPTGVALQEDAAAQKSPFPNMGPVMLSTDESVITLNACALGWSLTELVCRAHLPYKARSPENWSAAYPVMLRQANQRTSAEREKALVTYIWRILQALQLDKLQTHEEYKGGEGSQFIDVVKSTVDELYKIDHSNVANKEKLQLARSDLNEQIFWWDEQLQDTLPALSQRAYAGYQAARGLAEIAWESWYVDEKTLPSLLTPTRVQELEAFILSLTPVFKSPFTAPALYEGIRQWAPVMRQEDLYKATVVRAQGDIWRDLLTGAREPESYVRTGTSVLIQWRFTWSVIASTALPLTFAVGIAVLTAAILFWVVNQIFVEWIHVKTTGAFQYQAASPLTASIVAILAGLGIGKWMTDHISLGANEAATSIWASAQQRAINKQVVLAPQRKVFGRF